MRNATVTTMTARLPDNDNASAPVHAPEVLSLAEFMASRGAARALIAHGGGAMTALCDLLCEAYLATEQANDNRP